MVPPTKRLRELDAFSTFLGSGLGGEGGGGGGGGGGGAGRGGDGGGDGGSFGLSTIASSFSISRFLMRTPDSPRPDFVRVGHVIVPRTPPSSSAISTGTTAGILSTTDGPTRRIVVAP